MTQFGVSGTLEIDAVEGAAASFDDLGPVMVDVEPTITDPAAMEPAGTTMPDPAATGQFDDLSDSLGDPEAQYALDEERNDLLVELLDEVQSGAIGGGGGDGGGGVLPLPPAGKSVLGGGAGGGVASLIGGLGAGTAGLIGGGVAAAGATIGGARYAMGEGLFGDEGRETLAARTEFEGIEGAKNAVEDPLGAAGTGFKNMIDPTGLGETAARKGVNEVASQTNVDEQIMDGFERGVDFWDQQLTVPEPPDNYWPDLPDPAADFWPTLPEPQGVEYWPTLPEPQDTEYWPTLPEPQGTDYWPDVPSPSSNFWPDLPELPEPDWVSVLEDLAGGGGDRTPSPTNRQQRRFDGTARDPSYNLPAGPAIDVDGLVDRVNQLERALQGGP